MGDNDIQNQDQPQPIHKEKQPEIPSTNIYKAATSYGDHPSTAEEAKWKEARISEMNSLEKNNTGVNASQPQWKESC